MDHQFRILFCVSEKKLEFNRNRSKISFFINYRKEVLQEANNIDNGLGLPIPNLVGFLLIAWIFIAGVLIKGIRSSGKASYFLALFPYVIIFILLIRALTLPGAWNGILFFIKPKWSAILEPSVSFSTELISTFDI